MKAICIIIFLLISFGFNSHTQKLKIYVSEVIDISGYDSTIYDLIKNSSNEQTIRSVNTFYDLDLTEKTFKFFKSNELITEGEFSFHINDDIIEINFINEGFIDGLIVNTKISNEQVVWFGIFGEYKEACKFTRFEIIKSS
jgi:hypothetical protein